MNQSYEKLNVIGLSGILLTLILHNEKWDKLMNRQIKIKCCTYYPSRYFVYALVSALGM